MPGDIFGSWTRHCYPWGRILHAPGRDTQDCCSASHEASDSQSQPGTHPQRSSRLASRCSMVPDQPPLSLPPPRPPRRPSKVGRTREASPAGVVAGDAAPAEDQVALRFQVPGLRGGLAVEDRHHLDRTALRTRAGLARSGHRLMVQWRLPRREPESGGVTGNVSLAPDVSLASPGTIGDHPRFPCPRPAKLLPDAPATI